MTSNSNPAEWLREMIRIETEGERSPKLPPIKTYYDPKPVPDPSHDWVAYFDGFEPGEPIGYGATRDAAIAALLREVGE
jgi:hypothetical protein